MRKPLLNGLITLTLTVIIAITLTACSKAKEVPTGLYYASDKRALVAVQDENQLMVAGPVEVSATFTGKYTIEGNKLILSIEGQEDYIFLIGDQSLTLESGEWLENWADKGTVFRLTEE